MIIFFGKEEINMRKSAKRLVSAVVAVVSAMTMALSVSAADYFANPSYAGTPSQSVSVPTSELKDAAKSAVSGSSNASVDVNSTRKLQISTSVIKELAKSKDAVLEIVSPKATITIDSSTITKVRNVDLSMEITNSKSRTTIDMRSKKDFGCEVKITVTTCKMSAEKLANAHVYCNGEDMGPVELDEDGNPVITVTKGGEYVIK